MTALLFNYFLFLTGGIIWALMILGFLNWIFSLTILFIKEL